MANAFEAGTNVVLQVSDGTSPTVYTTVPGQQQTSFGGSSDTADTTDKSNSGWRTNITTLINGDVECSGAAKWDTTLDTLQTAWRTRTTVDAKVVLNADGKAYFGDFNVTNFGIDGPYDGATQFNISLSPNGALNYIP